MNRAARDAVVSDPEILGGTPVLRGTRVPVHDVAASVAAGLPLDRILAAYPSLDADKIALATIYGQACPVSTRTPVSQELPKGIVMIADRRAPRRRTVGIRNRVAPAWIWRGSSTQFEQDLRISGGQPLRPGSRRPRQFEGPLRS